jgi:hypothetical protein
LTTVTRDSQQHKLQLTIASSSLSANNDPYDVQVTNGEGIASILTSQVNFNQTPVFVTASGSLGTVTTNTAGSFSVNATDPDSAGNVTFELQSGSLPPGYSITNTAADGGTAIISGTDSTTSSTTTFNFVLRAVDAASNTSSRSFSIQSAVPVSESFTSSGTFSVPAYVTQADVLVVGAGGNGGYSEQCGRNGGGGGAGGLIFFPNYPFTSGGTVTVTIGAPNGQGSPQPGQDTIFGSPGDPGLGQGGVLTAKGGGHGGTAGCVGVPGSDGGSGGGAGQAPGAVGSCSTATQPTQPGNSGAYGFGNYGRNALPVGQRGNGGGGGGGAGAGGGANQPGGVGGAGGIGRAYTIADGTTPVYYAGGGGAGGDTGGAGACGGGASGVSGAGQGNAGQANKGGGGGGTASRNPGTAYPGAPARGGSGIVIVRY